MKKLCTHPGCKVIVEGGGYRCPQHPSTYVTPKKRYDWHFYNNRHIYTSARWKRLRAQQLSLHPTCCMCEQFGIITSASVADHVVEIKDGGEVWSLENLQSLCTACHNRKTGEEVRKRNEKKRLNGFKSLSDF